MSEYEKEQLEMDFRRFISRHFEAPSRCRNLEQTRFYIKEIRLKISEYKSRFNHVPEYAYILLRDYNYQNKEISRNSREMFSY